VSNEKLVALKRLNVFFSSDHLLYLFCIITTIGGKFRSESINKLINTICLLGFNLTEVKYNQVINRRGEIQRGLLYFFKLEFSTTTTSRCAPTAQRRCNFRLQLYALQYAGSTITDDMAIARTMSMSTTAIHEHVHHDGHFSKQTFSTGHKGQS
jgi:hypothetical protein